MIRFRENAALEKVGFNLMLERWGLSGCRPLVAALYAAAMLSLGLAHSYAGLPDTTVFEAAALQVAAFASLDGVWSPIRGKSKPDVPMPASASVASASFSCDACQRTAAPGEILPQQLLAGPPPAAAMKRPPPRTLAFAASMAVVEPQSRGPPLHS